MSKVRYLYRRISAKSGTAKAPARQHPSSFFEFGGEHAFFSGKELSAPAARPAYQNPAVAKKEAPLKEEYAIQRTPVTGDFGITGKDPDSAADDSIIRFDKGQTTVAEPERGKIKREAKKHKKVELNLNGFTSEEGSATENTRVANGRVNNVSALLHLAGHEGIRHKKPDISAGEGNSNYRSRRVVEIKPTFIAPGVPSVSSIDPCTTKTVPCAASFSGIVPLSLRKVIKAIIALSAPDAATAAQLNAFFGASPAAVVLGNLGALLGEMIVLAGAHDPAADCRKDSCDDTCAKGASAYVDLNVAPAKMIFCESLLAASADERAEVFIHEALHATPGVLTQDIAYAHTRKMLTISDAEKLKNTDSYVMLIRMLDNPLAAATTPPKDTITGAVTPAETDFALRIIAFLEQWLIASKFTTGDLYSKVQEALLNPAGWQSPEGWYHHSMRDLNPLFGLTDPGPSDPFAVPVRDDKIRLAGIGDRYFRMREVLHSAPVTLSKTAAAPEAWAKELGNQVNVLPAFFSKTELDAVRHLMLLMLRSMSDVPASLRTVYVDGADKIRASDSIGP